MFTIMGVLLHDFIFYDYLEDLCTKVQWSKNM